ncbi:Nitroreductase [Xylariales sp. AK1849]|nr:Nitroreductase [Xylariales sp. AK1849]
MADVSALLQARYGNAKSSGFGSANPTLETLLQHRSVRNFIPQLLEPGTLEVLVAAGQSAATSSNLQTWSVVAIEDTERKDKAATLSGDQDFIRKAPLFLVFCADLSRLTKVSQLRQTPGEGLEYTEMFLMASIDAALAAQNVSVAAESLGLGICYVGGVRNKPRDLAELLRLPDRVIALFGLAIGRPDSAQPTSVKPRLALDEVLHRETWAQNAEKQVEVFTLYDNAIASFNAGQKREGVPAWTERSARRVATVGNLTGRHVWHQVLQERGFDLK